MRTRLSRLLQGPALNRVTMAMIIALIGLEIADAGRIWVLACAALGLVAWLIARWPEGVPPGEHASPASASEPASTPSPDAAPWNAVAESLPALVWIIDERGRVVKANRRALDYLGAGPDGPIRLAEAMHETERDGFEAARRPQHREFHLQARLRRHDGAERWHFLVGIPFLQDGKADGRLVCAVDIEPLKIAQEAQFRRNVSLRTQVAETAQRLHVETAARAKTERQLRHAQKMDALSRLAGGVAHDLNNKLIVISANIDAVAKHIKDAPHLRRRLLAALVASDQAAETISKLLAFAGRHDQKPCYIDVAERLHSICTLLERSFLSDSVEVRLDIEEGLWALEIDPHAFETAVVNLAVNARDAMAGGGTIRIAAANLSLPGGRRTGDLDGDVVRISVGDTGRGIPPEHLDRVFEPFFTTKEASRFSGLGLSQVRSFAEGLGGTAAIDSAPGRGTVVSLYLPKAELRARIGVPPCADEFIEDEEANRPGAAILVVDDEIEVALALQGMLIELGYEPRIALGAEEALAEIAADPPVLVLADVTMPGPMDGVSLGRAIRDAHPALPVMLITGNPTVVAGMSEFPLLQKPIASRALDAALRRHLGPGEPGNVVPLFPEGRRRAGGP